MNSKIIFNPRKELWLSTAVIFFSGISFAQAQETKPVKDSTSDKQIEEVVLVGSRSGGRSKADSPVPVDVFNLKDIQQSLPQTNINQILNTIAPSFTSTIQTNADGSDHSDPAQLRESRCRPSAAGPRQARPTGASRRYCRRHCQ